MERRIVFRGSNGEQHNAFQHELLTIRVLVWVPHCCFFSWGAYVRGFAIIWMAWSKTSLGYVYMWIASISLRPSWRSCFFNTLPQKKEHYSSENTLIESHKLPFFEGYQDILQTKHTRSLIPVVMAGVFLGWWWLPVAGRGNWGLLRGWFPKIVQIFYAENWGKWSNIRDRWYFPRIFLQTGGSTPHQVLSLLYNEHLFFVGDRWWVTKSHTNWLI